MIKRAKINSHATFHEMMEIEKRFGPLPLGNSDKEASDLPQRDIYGCEVEAPVASKWQAFSAKWDSNRAKWDEFTNTIRKAMRVNNQMQEESRKKMFNDFLDNNQVQRSKAQIKKFVAMAHKNSSISDTQIQQILLRKRQDRETQYIRECKQTMSNMSTRQVEDQQRMDTVKK